jgi:ATP dependent DNA ligase C terminal region
MCRPPRDNCFGSPLVLIRVHWVRPELLAEVKFLTWTEDNLLRQVVYQGLREDKPAAEVRRLVPHPGVGGFGRTARGPSCITVGTDRGAVREVFFSENSSGLKTMPLQVKRA